MITSTMKRQGIHASQKPKKKIHPSPAVDEPEEELRILDQEINKDAIESALDKPGTLSSRDIQIAKKILLASP